MICLADTAITIIRPIDEVFNYVIDLENFSNWFPAVKSVASANTKSKDHPGKRYRETIATTFGGEQSIEICVVEVISNQLFATEGQLPSLLPRMEITFQELAEKNTTEVRWCMYSRRNSGLGRFLITPLARRVMSRRAPIGLRKLKSILEATDSNSSLATD